MATICRASITLRNGKTLFAKDYGMRAFCFDVDDSNAQKENSPDAPEEFPNEAVEAS